MRVEVGVGLWRVSRVEHVAHQVEVLHLLVHPRTAGVTRHRAGGRRRSVLEELVLQGRLVGVRVGVGVGVEVRVSGSANPVPNQGQLNLTLTRVS